MPLPIRIWLVWMALSMRVMVATMVINEAGNFSTRHWSFVLNGWAGACLGGGLCFAILFGAVAVLLFA